MFITYDEGLRCFHLCNGSMSYIFRLTAGKYPLHVYWGPRVRRVSDDLLTRLSPYNYTDETFRLDETPLDVLPQECPVFGGGDMREGMLDVIHADGTRMLDLQYAGYRVEEGKPALPGMPSARGEGAKTLVLTLRDALSGLEAELYYTIWPDMDVIARRMRVVNGGSSNVLIERALSACVDFEKPGLQLTTLSGAWARERQMYTRPVVPGDQGTSTCRGASSVQTSPFMALSTMGTDECCGEVFAFALCYSGSFTAEVTMDQHFLTRAMIGINPFNFSWDLAPGAAFDTPEAYLCFSAEGFGGMSRQFHTLVHEHITSGKYAKSERPILCNNWEATYFDFNEEKILALAKRAKDADIDLLVLDDGWFGHRDADNSSLGDWYDDTRKLPQGIAGLGEKIHALGLKFGLWVEPEMISPDSDLYRAHPDWCIHAGDYPRIESRNQLVLDLTREDVREYVVEAISAALRRGNVDYVKWDMNRNINCWGSAKLDAAHQRELGHRYILGLYEIMGRIVSQFPDVLFESCAGGGGRFDLALMTMMPQAWASDDTDAWMRCRIQYATSLVFPPSVMGAHVSAVPNHQTHRSTPLETRAAVAMGGTFGYELDLTQLPQEEIDQIREINARVRAMQKLLYYGTFYRLRSPFTGNDSAWMSVSEDKREAIVTHVNAQAFPHTKPMPLRLAGLDPELDYMDVETGRIYGGDELMLHGMPLKKIDQGDYLTTQAHFKAVN